MSRIIALHPQTRQPLGKASSSSVQVSEPEHKPVEETVKAPQFVAQPELGKEDVKPRRRRKSS